MKNLFLPLCLFFSFSTGSVTAQDATSTPTPTPTEVHDTTVNVNVPAQPEPAPPPAPDVNVHVDAPAPAAAPVVNTEKTTKESSVTRVIETPNTQSDNTILYIAGGCIGVLALGAIIVASKSR